MYPAVLVALVFSSSVQVLLALTSHCFTQTLITAGNSLKTNVSIISDSGNLIKPGFPNVLLGNTLDI